MSATSIGAGRLRDSQRRMDAADRGELAQPPTATAQLSPLLRSALEHVPTTSREQAAKLAVMGEIGFGEMEIARELGMTWKSLDRLRAELKTGVLRAFQADGFTDDDIRRTLGLGASQVHATLHEPACMRGISGEREQQCQCRRIRAARQHEGGDKDYTHDGEAW